jgi:hypothetical protein
VTPDENLEQELLHVAAVAVAWIETLRRRRAEERTYNVTTIGGVPRE